MTSLKPQETKQSLTSWLQGAGKAGPSNTEGPGWQHSGGTEDGEVGVSQEGGPPSAPADSCSVGMLPAFQCWPLARILFLGACSLWPGPICPSGIHPPPCPHIIDLEAQTLASCPSPGPFGGNRCHEHSSKLADSPSDLAIHLFGKRPPPPLQGT